MDEMEEWMQQKVLDQDAAELKETGESELGSSRLVVLMFGESVSVVSMERDDEDRVSSSIVAV